MKIDKTRLKELATSQSRTGQAIHKAINMGSRPLLEDLMPLVLEAYKTGKHRSLSYITKSVKDTIKWLTY